MTGALIGVSMPIFWLGLMVMWLFAFKLGWFPPSGRLTVGVELQEITNFFLVDSILTGNWTAFKDALSHLILPGFSLATIPMAMIARMTRSGMLEVLGKDYIKTARAKGLKERIVIYKHAFRNALVTVITVIGLQFGILLGGAVLTETIFSWPGVGKYLYEAIMNRDYPAVQGTILAFSFAFVTINLIVDLLYAVIDPKIRYD
jgi:peptide/nickel transport system permease protein